MASYAALRTIAWSVYGVGLMAMHAFGGESPGVDGARMQEVQPTTYRFGRFMLDCSRRTLLSESGARPLPEKVFQILMLLLEANGATVAKQTFLRRIWPEGYVSEGNLTQQIFLLRGFLGESLNRNEYILTVAGGGYRFAKTIESKRGLSMKDACERCMATLSSQDLAMICSYECTFCVKCAYGMNSTCPNCGGELTKRPRRRR